MKKKLQILLCMGILTAVLAACGTIDITEVGKQGSQENEKLGENQESDRTITVTAEGGLTYEVPVEFKLDEANSKEGTLYYVSEIIGEISSVKSTYMENDGSFDRINPDKMMEELEAELKETYATDPKLELIEEGYYEIDGRKAYKYIYQYELYSTILNEINCIIEDGDKLYYITYTELEGENYGEVYAEAFQNIRFE